MATTTKRAPGTATGGSKIGALTKATTSTKGSKAWDNGKTYRLPASPLSAATRSTGAAGVRAARASLSRHIDFSLAKSGPRNSDCCADPFEAKVRRLTWSGCLRILLRDTERVHARVLGDSGVDHEVACDAEGRWSCTCPNWSRSCSHIVATQRVVGMEVPR